MLSEKEVNQRAFRSVLLRAVLLPVVVMLVLAGVLVWQINRLRDASEAVEHSDRILAAVNLLEKLHIDLETGVRGFLVTGDELFLEPYSHAIPEIDRVYAELGSTLTGRPLQLRELNDLRDTRAKWIAYSQKRMQTRRDNGPWTDVAVATRGKGMMDEMRRHFTRMQALETAQRDERSITARRSAQVTVVGASILTLLVGLAMAAVARGQLGWLAVTYEKALRESRELSTTLERRVEDRTQALSAANDQLGDANKELEAFAYSISHDLRAPMRHITGFSQLLQASMGKDLSKDDAENLQTILDTAVLAGRMVDDLLAFSRVGRTQLRSTDVDVQALVDRCVVELGPEIRERQIAWNIHDLQPTRGDPALLKMVFQNLLSNAVKYSAGREPAEIEVTSRAGGPDNSGGGAGGGVTFIIRDNGVGFDMKYAHKLFGVFQRLHRSEEFEGTGIGLANVRRIIVRHGGQVWAESVPGEGATFFVYLPG